MIKCVLIISIIIFSFFFVSCSKQDVEFSISIKNIIPLWDDNIVRSAHIISEDELLLYRKFPPFFSIVSLNESRFNEIITFCNKGKGPDEIIEPASELVFNDTIFIVDFKGNKISKFLYRGKKIYYIENEMSENIYRMHLFNNKLINTYYGFIDITLYNETEQKIIESKESLSKDVFTNMLLNDSFILSNENNMFVYYPLTGRLKIYDHDLNKIEDFMLNDYIKLNKKTGVSKKGKKYIIKRLFYNYFLYDNYLIFFNHNEDEINIDSEKTEFYPFDWKQRKFISKFSLSKNLHFIIHFNEYYIGISNDSLIRIKIIDRKL